MKSRRALLPLTLMAMATLQDVARAQTTACSFNWEGDSREEVAFKALALNTVEWFEVPDQPCLLMYDRTEHVSYNQFFIPMTQSSLDQAPMVVGPNVKISVDEYVF